MSIALCMVSYYIMFKAYFQDKAVTSYVSDDKAVVLAFKDLGGGDIKDAVEGTIDFIKDPTMKNTGEMMKNVGAVLVTVLMTSNPVGAAIGGAMLVVGGLLSAFGPDEEEIAKEKFENDLKQNMT